MTTLAKHDWENRFMLNYLPAEQEIRRTIRDSYPHEGNGRSQHRLNYKPRHCRQFETEEELSNWLADGNKLETHLHSDDDFWLATEIAYNDDLPKGHKYTGSNDWYDFYEDESGYLYYMLRQEA